MTRFDIALNREPPKPRMPDPVPPMGSLPPGILHRTEQFTPEMLAALTEETREYILSQQAIAIGTSIGSGMGLQQQAPVGQMQAQQRERLQQQRSDQTDAMLQMFQTIYRSRPRDGFLSKLDRGA